MQSRQWWRVGRRTGMLASWIWLTSVGLVQAQGPDFSGMWTLDAEASSYTAPAFSGTSNDTSYPFRKKVPGLTSDAVLTLTLDCDAGTFAVAVNGEPKPELTFSEGIAGKTWIPVAGTTSGGSSVTLVDGCEIEQHALESQLSDGCVVQILDCAVLDRDNLRRQADACSRRTGKANAIRHFGPHVLVMERGERDLADIIAHNFVAGADKAKVAQIGRRMAECLLQLERAKRIHGDVKPRNAMEFRELLEAMIEAMIRPVSYTHLTLPTNREV